MYHFCERFIFTKSTQYLILNASKGLCLEMQNPEGSPLPIFRRYETFPAPFRLCETFSKFFKVFEGDFFWCFAPECMLKKPKGPPFTFFGTMRLLKILIFRFFWKIFKNFRNFPMSPKGRSIFLYFATNWLFKKPKEPPSTILTTLRCLSLGYGAVFRRSRLVFF